MTRTTEPGIVKREGKRGTTYRATVDLGTDPVSGKRIQQSAHFRTRAEARAWLHRVRGDLAHGSYTQPSRERLASFLAHWLATRSDLAPRSRSRYEVAIRRHIVPALGETELGRLTGRHIQELLNAHAGTSVPRAVVAVLGQALDLAVREGLIARNPARGLLAPRPPKAEDAPPQTWSAEQLRAFLDAAETERLCPLFHTLAYTGLRLGEALALTWEHVDLDVAALRVTGDVKTTASRRRIALDPETVAVLRAHAADQERQRDLLGAEWQEQGLVFERGDGRRLHPRTVQGTMDRVLGRLPDLPRLTPHGLRHTHASALLTAGRPLHYVQARLGHGSAATTLGFYAHVIPNTERGDAAAFAAWMAAGDEDTPPAPAWLRDAG